MFEQAFKNIDDVLRKEAGCTTELDYTEHSSWLQFLKYLDGLEAHRAAKPRWTGRNIPTFSTNRFGGRAGRHRRGRMASWTITPRLRAMTCGISSAGSCFRICTGSIRKQAARTRLSTRSAKSSARLKTRFRAGTTCGRL